MNSYLKLSPMGSALTACGLLALSLPVFAQAQVASNNAPAAGLEEIIVTAQKVSQLASKTPISLTAINGDTLHDAGITSAKNLADLVPNVQIGAASGPVVEIAIRGIASVNNSEVGDPAASFNVDGVPLGRPQSAGATFFDLERIEVLRGPQGTLYGRNSTAGAVNLISKKPVNKFESVVYAEIGNYNATVFEAMLNVPVSDQFALRGVVSVSKHDGYIDAAHSPENNYSKDRSDRDNVSARLQGVISLSKDASLRLSADISQDKGAGNGGVLYDTVAANQTGAKGRFVTLPVEGSLDDESYGLAAELNVSTSIGEFTAIGSHRQIDRVETQPQGAATTIYTIDTSLTKQDTLEMRLNGGEKSSLQWVAGAFFFDEKGGPIQRLVPNVLNRKIYVNPMVNKSQALFGQATYSVAPDLRLTLGLRYTKDKKSREGFFLPLVGTVGAAGNNAAKVEYNKNTGKVGIEYDYSPTTLVYGTVSTGYKAGGFNDGVQTATADPTYKPESLTAYEAGAKGKFMNNTLQLNASVFQYKFKDMQLSGFGVNPFTGLEGTFTRSAAKATVTGAELEGRVLMTSNDRLTFALAFLDGKYDEYQITKTISWKDYKLDKSPKNTLALSYTHDWNLSGGAQVSANLGANWSSSYVFSNYGAALQFAQNSFIKTNFNVIYRSADDKWNVQAYVKNITDRNVIVAYQSTQVNSAYLDEPRTIGVRVGYKF